MRGRPVFELLLVAAVSVLLLFPLRVLTRARVFSVSPEVAAEDSVEIPIWIDVRFSHAPDQFEVFQDGVSLGTGSGDLRWDEDAVVSFEGGVFSLRIEGRLQAGVDWAYLEVSVEPDSLSSQRRGIWIRDEFSHVMEFRWTEN